MKRILMIATGGTIASVETDDGLTPGLTAKELLSAVPGIRTYCDVEVLPLYNIDSTNVTVEHWRMLTQAIQERYDVYDGFVISHGTDTLAYTAAALSCMIQHAAKPIVLTGSQLPMGEPGTDAIRNLSDAFIYAVDEGSHGVSVVFGGRAIDGMRARKMCTKSFDAFASINYPELAQIQNGAVLRKEVRYIEDKPEFYLKMNPDVCVLKLTPDLNPVVLEWILEHVTGVILEGFGSGGIPQYLEETFLSGMEKRCEKGYMTMMATQAFLEGTDMDVYEVGRRVKSRTGILECRDMTIEAATAKMMWILGLPEDEARKQKEKIK